MVSATLMVAVMIASSGAPAQAVSAVAPPGSSGHGYRHGVVPQIGSAPARAAAGRATGTGPLAYGGGVSGVGVTTGAPKV
ncbi:MAG: hypothetical protein M3N98_13825, partial [Actinomycetota bacterium]|nr:hypothetical protein [Actinomycetota bacterium]